MRLAGTQHMQNVEQVAQTLKRNDIDTLAQAWSPETIDPHELFRLCLDDPRELLFKINGN